MLKLPAVDLDWYDVAAGTWSRVHLDALTLEVAPAAAGSLVTPPPSQVPAAPVAPVLPVDPKVSAPGLEMSPAISPPGFWPWLSLALGFGWLATLVLLWWRRCSPSSAKVDPSAGSGRRDTEPATLKAVFEAAGRNDPQAARQALLRWSRLRFPKDAGRELEALRRIGGAPLTAALAELDQALYGSAQEPWRGEALCVALKKLPQEQKQAAAGLPPLYPAE
jgi:hypothetical protein